MIFRRKDRDRGNPTDLLQRLRSLHDLLDPTTENTGETEFVEHHQRGRELTVEVGPATPPPQDAPATFDDDVPLLMDVVTPEELARRPAATPKAPPAPDTPAPVRPLSSDAEVVRALAAFELAVSRHLGHEFDAARNQVMRSEIRRSLTRMLTELETRWKEK